MIFFSPEKEALFKNFIIILLYNIVLVLPYINMNPPRVYTCSQSWTPLPPPSPYHPSGSSQCTNPKHPVSCIEPRLAIRFLYDITHVSMPFSQIIPPSPSPTESKRLFYIHLCLFCGLAYRVIIAINWWIFNFPHKQWKISTKWTNHRCSPQWVFTTKQRITSHHKRLACAPFVTTYPKGDSILICEAWHTSSICELYVKGIVLLVVSFLVSTYFIQHYLWLIYIVVHEFYSIQFYV